MKKHGVIHYFLTALYYLITRIALSLASFALGMGGYIVFINTKTPLNLIIGAPLMFIGIGLTLNFLYTSVLIIFSPTYNRGMCKLCNSK